MGRATYVCIVGEPTNLTDDERAELCKCKHARNWHWFGGGSCGECGTCEYFRPKPKPKAK